MVELHTATFEQQNQIWASLSTFCESWLGTNHDGSGYFGRKNVYRNWQGGCQTFGIYHSEIFSQIISFIIILKRKKSKDMAVYPIPVFHFKVEWGGKNVGFSEVSGLTQEVQMIEY